MKRVEGEQNEFALDRPALKSFVSRRNERDELGPRAKAEVEIAYFQREDWEGIDVERPTIGFRLRVAFPAGKYQVFAEPDTFLAVHFKVEKADAASGAFEWSIGRALLPGQGLSFEWEPASGTD